MNWMLFSERERESKKMKQNLTVQVNVKLTMNWQVHVIGEFCGFRGGTLLSQLLTRCLSRRPFLFLFLFLERLKGHLFLFLSKTQRRVWANSEKKNFSGTLDKVGQATLSLRLGKLLFDEFL